MAIYTVESAIQTMIRGTGMLAAEDRIESSPFDGPYPAIVYKMLSARDVTMTDGFIVMSPLRYLIVAVTESSSIASAKNLVQAIHTGLHNKAITNGDGQVLVCQREQPYTSSYRGTNGKDRQQVGGIYVFYARGN